MYMHGGWDWTLLWSFTLTLYSLDVVSVNISICFPRCKKKRGLMKGSSRPAVSAGYAPHRCSIPVQGSHHTNINSSVSSSFHPTLPLLLLLLSTTLFHSFSRGRNISFQTWFFFVPSLHLASSVSLTRHGTSISLCFKLACYIST